MSLKIKMCLFFISLCSSVLLNGQKQIIDQVIARVGNENILHSEVEEQYSYAVAQQGVLPEGARCSILEQLMSQKLLVNQAKLDSVVVAEEEVEAQMNARFERILQMMGGDVKQFEDFYGESIPEAKETIRGELRNQLLAERMQAQIISETNVTPAEVKAFFDQIPQDSLPYFGSEVEIREIVMFPQVNSYQDSLAKAQLEDLRRRIIEEGADFAELARKFSDDPGSGRQGGNLGMTRRGSFVPEFEAAAYNLEEKEFSKVIKSEFGYHLIQLLERRGNAINTRHILIKPNITEADLEKTRQKLDSVRQLILSDSITFSQAVKRYSTDKVQSFNNDGLLVNPQSGNAIFEIGDLEPDIYFTIDTMEVGDISAPIESMDARGETQFRIMLLQSRTKPHIASLSQDYSKIQQAAINEKKARYVSDWVSDKINNTYVDLTVDYQTCPNLQKWQRDKIKP